MAVSWEIIERGENYVVIELEDGIKIKVAHEGGKMQVHWKDWWPPENETWVEAE